MIKAPKYLIHDERGRVIQVLCKICGGVVMDRGRPTEDHVNVVLHFSVGGDHVTALCRSCFNTADVASLHEAYEADCEQLCEQGFDMPIPSDSRTIVGFEEENA